MSTVARSSDLALQRSALEARRAAARGRLAALARRLRAHLAVDGLFWTALAAVGLAAASLALDWLLRPERSARIVLGIAALAAIGAVAWRRLVRPLAVRLAPLDLAQLLDRRLPGVGEQLANVLQLPDLVEADLLASPSLIVATVERQSVELAGANWSSLLASSRRNWQLAAVALLAAGVAACALGLPEVTGLWARRWLLGSQERWPQRIYLTVDGLAGETARLSVPKGEAFNLQVSTDRAFRVADDGWRLDGRGEPLVIRTAERPQGAPPDEVRIVYGSANSQRKEAHLVRYGDNQFRYEMPPLVEPTWFSLAGGDDWLAPIWIDPIERPRIAELTLVATPPGGPAQSYALADFDAQLAFLPTTGLELTLVAAEPLAGAELSAGDGQAIEWRELNETTWQARWQLAQPVTLEMRLSSAAGHLASKPYYLSIGVQQDREPRVSIRASGVGRRVTPSAQVPLVLRVLDDFGIGRIDAELEHTAIEEDKPRTDSRRLEIAALDDAPQPVLETERRHTVPLAEYGLQPGTSLRLRGTAQDRSVLGPRSGASRWLTFQVVTPEELFYEILTRQREQRARFAAATKLAQGLATAFDALEDAEGLAGISRSQQVVARQAWQIANQLAASHEELTLNDLGTPQARDLLANNVIAPLRGLHEEQLPRLKRELDALAAGGQFGPDERAPAAAAAGETVAAMQKILDQMSQWESFVDVVNQLRQVIKLQNELLEATGALRKKATEALFDE